eukprot:364995-Chlamydomonas_euryale.AAC.15
MLRCTPEAGRLCLLRSHGCPETQGSAQSQIVAPQARAVCRRLGLCAYARSVLDGEAGKS